MPGLPLPEPFNRQPLIRLGGLFTRCIDAEPTVRPTVQAMDLISPVAVLNRRVGQGNRILANFG